ncbi:MAG: hypothetical protein AAF405_02320 [Pseudomonadota bacterium]
MQTSVFLARLMGPVLLAVAVSMFVNGDRQVAMARQFLENPPLIFISGMLILTAGLAIVLHHNVWVADWRVIITVFGWLAVIGGVLRIVFFQSIERIGAKMLVKPWVMPTGAVVAFVLGSVLSFFGYSG